MPLLQGNLSRRQEGGCQEHGIGPGAKVLLQVLPEIFHRAPIPGDQTPTAADIRGYHVLQPRPHSRFDRETTETPPQGIGQHKHDSFVGEKIRGRVFVQQVEGQVRPRPRKDNSLQNVPARPNIYVQTTHIEGKHIGEEQSSDEGIFVRHPQIVRFAPLRVRRPLLRNRSIRIDKGEKPHHLLGPFAVQDGIGDRETRRGPTRQGRALFPRQRCGDGGMRDSGLCGQQ